MFAECLPLQHSAKKLCCKIEELASKNDINVHIQQKNPLFHALLFVFQIKTVDFSFFIISCKKNYYSMYFIVQFNLYQQNCFDQVFYKILININ